MLNLKSQLLMQEETKKCCVIAMVIFQGKMYFSLTGMVMFKCG